MRVINFDKGSKRRIRQIRWTRFELFSIVLLTVLLLTFCLLFGLWEASHGSAQSWAPQLQEKR